MEFDGELLVPQDELKEAFAWLDPQQPASMATGWQTGYSPAGAEGAHRDCRGGRRARGLPRSPLTATSLPRAQRAASLPCPRARAARRARCCLPS